MTFDVQAYMEFVTLMGDARLCQRDAVALVIESFLSILAVA